MHRESLSVLSSDDPPPPPPRLVAAAIPDLEFLREWLAVPPLWPFNYTDRSILAKTPTTLAVTSIRLGFDLARSRGA